MKVSIGGNQKPIEDVKEIEFTHREDGCYIIMTLNSGKKRTLSSYGVKKIEE